MTRIEGIWERSAVLNASGAFRAKALILVDLFGSSGRTRTYNPSVNSRMLVALGRLAPFDGARGLGTGLILLPSQCKLSCESQQD